MKQPYKMFVATLILVEVICLLMALMAYDYYFPYWEALWFFNKVLYGAVIIIGFCAKVISWGFVDE